jgi:predicted nucleotidyltransferase
LNQDYGQVFVGIRPVEDVMADEAKLRAIRSTWKARELRKCSEESARRESARKRAEAVAALLKDRYSVKEVWLLGSLAWGKHFSARSDIDLYVAGLTGEADYWEVLSQAEWVAAPFPLQLILAEGAPPSLKERVLKEGVRL